MNVAARRDSVSVREPSVLEQVDDNLDRKVANKPGAQRQTSGEQAGVYLTAFVALIVPALIVLAFFLPALTTASIATVDDLPAPTTAGLDAKEIPNEPAAIEAPLVSTAAPPPAGNTEPIEKTPTVDDPRSTDIRETEPDSIDVFVYDETPSTNSEYTFALRLKSVSTQAPIDTSAFLIAVENAQGETASTTLRFVHDSLPVGSSALATVRASDTGDAENFVVITLGDVQIARVPIIFG